MKNIAPFLVSVFVCSVSFAQERWIALQSNDPSPKIEVSGDASLIGETFSPASTFKIILTWTALDEKVATLQTAYPCADEYVPASVPQPLKMRDAMRYSSNDYFVQLAKALPAGSIERRLKLISWPPLGKMSDARAIVRGGDMKITIRQLHALTRQIAFGELPSTSKLKEAMNWESADPDAKIYAKTGTYDGAAWMTGFSEKGGHRRIVTILYTYQPPVWQAAREKSTKHFLELVTAFSR